jgi:hypothetical protein
METEVRAAGRAFEGNWGDCDRGSAEDYACVGKTDPARPVVCRLRILQCRSGRLSHGVWSDLNRPGFQAIMSGVSNDWTGPGS